MHFPVVIHEDRKTRYGVSVPDLPGCFSAGATIDEALARTREAIELHLEGLIEEGGVIPLPSPIERLRTEPDCAQGTWAFVQVDESTLRVKIARVCITLPQRILDAVDRHAKAHGETRSGLLARAAVKYIGRDSDSMPEVARGGAKLRGLRRGMKSAARKAR